MARLILDTGVLVAAARGQLEPDVLDGEDDVVLPAVAVAEYLAGLAGHDANERQQDQARFLDEVLAEVPVVHYDTHIARHHAALLSHVRRVGAPRGAHDLIIAASARATERELLTTDGKVDFGALPDVNVRTVDP